MFAGARAECVAQFLNAFSERAVGDGAPLPHLLDEFVFADQPAVVFSQISEHFIRLRTQMHRMAGPRKTSPCNIERILAEKMDSVFAHRCHRSIRSAWT